MHLLSAIESILFVASKPLSVKTIAKTLGKNEHEVAEAVDTLVRKYDAEGSGLHILHNGTEVQMGTNPVNAPYVDAFMKDEVAGELTKAQLETLTVVAYCGPVTRPELEQIRGVNCSIIIRNLLVRGLIQEVVDEESVLPAYQLSLEALSHLGVNTPSQLPDFETLHAHAHIQQVLQQEE